MVESRATQRKTKTRNSHLVQWYAVHVLTRGASTLTASLGRLEFELPSPPRSFQGQAVSSAAGPGFVVVRSPLNLKVREGRRAFYLVHVSKRFETEENANYLVTDVTKRDYYRRDTARLATSTTVWY
jgi:hypothetical protein